MEGERHCERLIRDYFIKVFTSSHPGYIESICEVVREKLKDEHITFYAERFSVEEFEMALH